MGIDDAKLKIGSIVVLLASVAGLLGNQIAPGVVETVTAGLLSGMDQALAAGAVLSGAVVAILQWFKKKEE